MSVVAIVPARGGSKGVPRKNLREVGGRSLLVRAIDAGRKAAGVDRVFVSTDDPEIQRAALVAGAEAPILRPDELASDTAPTFPVIQHAIGVIEAGGPRVSVIVLIEPTSPFRTAAHVAAAVARFRQGGFGSVATVMPLERKPENIFVKGDFLTRYIESPQERFSRRQDMAHLCRINSAVYVASRDDVMAGLLLPEPVGWVEMDAQASLNIDSLLDLAFADFLARQEGI